MAILLTSYVYTYLQSIGQAGGHLPKSTGSTLGELPSFYSWHGLNLWPLFGTNYCVAEVKFNVCGLIIMLTQTEFLTLPELHLQQKLNVVPQDIGSSLTTKNAINIVWGVSEVASEVAFTYVSVDSSRTVLEHHRPSHMQSGP